MIKLIRLFGLFVIISLILGVGSAFSGNTSNETKQEISTKELSTENVDNSFSESIEEEIKENIEEDISTGVVEKDEEKILEEKTVEKSEQQIEKNVDVPVMEEEIIQEEQQVEEKKEDKKVENNDIQKNEEIIEEKKGEVDDELERLMKQVEYATYDKCMEIGFEKAIEDSVNILGFSCPYIAYKGKIIGYRLQLDYTNPMEEKKDEKQPEFAFFL